MNRDQFEVAGLKDAYRGNVIDWYQSKRRQGVVYQDVVRVYGQGSRQFVAEFAFDIEVT